ncbi:hypothetical protein V8D89_015744 [Ganoderma adspersum]
MPANNLPLADAPPTTYSPHTLCVRGPSLIWATYARHVASMKPARLLITPANYFDHLGKQNFHSSYRASFATEILGKGAKAVLEGFIFAPLGQPRPSLVRTPARPAGPIHTQPPPRGARPPVHPLIHAGYGLESGLPGLGCSRKTPLSPMTYGLQLAGPPGAMNGSRVYALEILGRVANDEKYDPITAAFGEDLVRLADEWYSGVEDEDVPVKIVELFPLSALIYGVGWWAGRTSSPEGTFAADFPLMHLVTSVILLPSYAAHLSPGSFSLFAGAYFATSLAVSRGAYLACGSPALPLAAFYTGTTAMLTEPGAIHSVAPAEATLDTSDPSPDPWLRIIQSTLQPREDHLAKLQRALLHTAALLQTTPAGTLALAGADLDGAKVLDGTPFVRVVGPMTGRDECMRTREALGGRRLGLRRVLPHSSRRVELRF